MASKVFRDLRLPFSRSQRSSMKGFWAPPDAIGSRVGLLRFRGWGMGDELKSSPISYSPYQAKCPKGLNFSRILYRLFEGQAPGNFPWFQTKGCGPSRFPHVFQMALFSLASRKFQHTVTKKKLFPTPARGPLVSTCRSPGKGSTVSSPRH